MHKTAEDLTGRRFGKLVVISYSGLSNAKRRRTMWLCRCDCGREKNVSAMSLKATTKSCGCLSAETNTRIFRTHGHGFKNSRTYRIWANMIQRCSNPNSASYCFYGGAGISVSKEWESSFEAFLRDMGECPGKSHSIDRIDNSGNYCMGNCRWSTRKEQARNTSRNVKFLWLGEMRCVSELAEISGIGRPTIEGRLRRGWDIKRALTQQPKSEMYYNGRGKEEAKEIY